LLLALADEADDSANAGILELADLSRPGAALWPCRAQWGRRCPALARCRRRLPRAGSVLPEQDHLEIIVRDRVFPLFPQIAFLDERVDVWRARPGAVLAGEEHERAAVLLTPEEEFRFLFTLGHVLPGRHQHGHQDGHDAQRDEQHSHCVALFLTS
jgi:hypothetical protein